MTMRDHQRFTFSLLGLLVLALGAVAYGVPARGSAVAPTAATAATAAPAHQHEGDAAALPDDGSNVSLGDLTATWRDHAGRERTLMGADDGRATIVTMLYTSCTVSCPRLVADLKRIEGALGAAELARIEFVLVSLDPARDTPERLARFASELHLDPARWTLLTGDESTVRELAAVLRVRYLTDATGEIMHTNRIVVADESGGIVHWQEGVGTGVPSTVEAILRMRGH